LNRESKEKVMAPSLFRIILQVPDLDQAEAFYGKLLDDRGRRIRGASRHYIDCGPVILALVDPSIDGQSAKPLPDYIYFAVTDLQAIHQRARELGCLSTEDIHGEGAGEIVVRPWGERSFYVTDPWGNGLCFVDEKTLFTGK
jgi:catechol-2,3-dioxygenase